jgi:hypothetical protein
VWAVQVVPETGWMECCLLRLQRQSRLCYSLEGVVQVSAEPMVVVVAVGAVVGVMEGAAPFRCYKSKPVGAKWTLRGLNSSTSQWDARVFPKNKGILLVHEIRASLP